MLPHNKMGGKLRSFNVGAIVLLLFMFGTTQAHDPLNLVKLDSSFKGSMEDISVDRLPLPILIKHAGPSQHKSGKGRNLLRQDIKKDSGPSPGEGHEHFSRMHH
jgi:hypothetical protein